VAGTSTSRQSKPRMKFESVEPFECVRRDRVQCSTVRQRVGHPPAPREFQSCLSELRCRAEGLSARPSPTVFNSFRVISDLPHILALGLFRPRQSP
jgi:hypothetical protein